MKNWIKGVVMKSEDTLNISDVLDMDFDVFNAQSTIPNKGNSIVLEDILIEDDSDVLPPII